MNEVVLDNKEHCKRCSLYEPSISTLCEDGNKYVSVVCAQRSLCDAIEDRLKFLVELDKLNKNGGNSVSKLNSKMTQNEKIR